MHRQDVRIGQVDRLAADLDGELRGADDGGANALAGIDQRQAAAPAQFTREFAGKELREVTELLRLMAEQIFGDAP